jgi:hypothetical protein
LVDLSSEASCDADNASITWLQSRSASAGLREFNSPGRHDFREGIVFIAELQRSTRLMKSQPHCFQAGGPAGSAAGQIQDGCEPQDHEGAWPNGAAIDFAARRRGYRVRNLATQNNWTVDGSNGPITSDQRLHRNVR